MSKLEKWMLSGAAIFVILVAVPLILTLWKLFFQFMGAVCE